MKKLLMAVAVFSAGIALPAVAQTNWIGPYAGISVGHSKGTAEEVVALDGEQASDRYSARGRLFGAQLGYNYEFGNRWVLGLETEIQKSNVIGNRTLSAGEFGLPDLVTKTQLNWLGTTRLRVGYSFDKFLPYATAGIAYGSVKKTDSFGDFSTAVTQGAVGYAAGLGLEYAVSRNFSVRGEYLRTKLAISNTEIDAGGMAMSLKENLENNIARLSINVRF